MLEIAAVLVSRPRSPRDSLSHQLSTAFRLGAAPGPAGVQVVFPAVDCGCGHQGQAGEEAGADV
eukprot:1136404-Pelagomonas_calceolata.AAC.5